MVEGYKFLAIKKGTGFMPIPFCIENEEFE
jgi:hypothetical protein